MRETHHCSFPTPCSTQPDEWINPECEELVYDVACCVCRKRERFFLADEDDDLADVLPFDERGWQAIESKWGREEIYCRECAAEYHESQEGGW